MEYESLSSRHELFIAAATLGAHANEHEGFRQRDVKFLIDLFTNWVELALQRSGASFQNTQVLRYLEVLVREGYARKMRKGTRPVYRLTRTGLLELLSRMVEKPQLSRGAHFFFLYYFVRNYGPRIEEMVKSEGRQYPYALKIELERLLNFDELLKRELKYAAQELGKLQNRIQYAEGASALATGLLKKGEDLERVVLEAERKFPYDLNSQKPLSELIGSLPESARRWELETGNLSRAGHMWRPEKILLESYIRALESLRG